MNASRKPFFKNGRILFSAPISQGTPIFLVENRLVFAPPRSKGPSKQVPQTDFLQKGFSLIEVVVYTAVFSVVLVMIVGTSLGLSRAYGGFSHLSHIERSGAVVLERLTREARGAEGVDTGASTLGINPSILVLNTKDENGAARTAEFFVANDALHLKENGADAGALTGDKIAVSSFVARRMTTGRSEGVKIELALRSGEGAASTTKKFYATTLLRNSY